MDGIVLGTDLAATLEVKMGDTVRLITPDEILTPMGMSPLRTRAFKVVGIFSLGLYEFDSEYALRRSAGRRARVRPGPAASSSAAASTTCSRRPTVATDIPKRFGADYITQDWKQMNKSLFSALWLEKMAIVDHHRPDHDGRRASTSSRRWCCW